MEVSIYPVIFSKVIALAVEKKFGEL